MYQIENKPDVAAVLSNLAGIIETFNVPLDRYLQNIPEREICNPFQKTPWTGGGTGTTASAPDGFWEALGIRRLTFDQHDSRPAALESSYEGNYKAFGKWNKIKSDAMVQGLSGIFDRCSIIEFADWAHMDDASGSWDGLYRDVLKPLKKRDFQFIFHLGDVAGKGVFEIDEILDIIGDYASYGKVAVILENREADSLWCKLNGRTSVPVAPKERCLSLFHTMNIDALQILDGSRAVQFSREAQFDLIGRSPVSNPEVIKIRSGFSAGYQIGSLLQLETMPCMALGLAVSDGYAEPSSGSGSTQLLSYIHDWINLLN